MFVAWMIWLVLAEPSETSALSPVARVHNERGIALYEAGQRDEGIAELERAYAAMPDPLQYRAGRGKVVGSLRSALTRHYEATGAPRHLCRLRGILHRHRTELLAALGANGSPADVAGTDRAIATVDETLAGRPCEAEVAEPVLMPVVARVVKEAPAPLHPPSEVTRPERRLRIAGGVLLGTGVAAGIGAVIAGVICDGRIDRLDALDRWLESPAEVAEMERLAGDARLARTAAVVTGSLGGSLLVAGVAVLVRSRQVARRARVVPAVSANAWGLHIQGRF